MNVLVKFECDEQNQEDRYEEVGQKLDAVVAAGTAMTEGGGRDAGWIELETAEGVGLREVEAALVGTGFKTEVQSQSR